MGEFFSYLVCALGVAGALLNGIAAIRRTNGKRGVRLFAAGVCSAIAVVYLLQILGLLPSPLPSDLGRPLMAFAATALVAYGIVEA